MGHIGNIAVTGSPVGPFTGGGSPLVLTVTTTGAAETVTLTRITPDGGDVRVNWGDGNSTTITDGNVAATAHEYAVAGAYTLTISNFSVITYFNISGQSTISGDISGWTLPASLVNFRIFNTGVSGAPSTASAQAIIQYQYQNCSLSQADVDAVVQSIYDRRASFTAATPALNIGGTNATPSGTYQDGDPPTTGLEYVYEIANDPETEGFNTWTVTYNGGTAP